MQKYVRTDNLWCFCRHIACPMSVSVCLFRVSCWCTLASFHIFKTDSDHCADMTYSCPVCGSETHIKPHWFFLPYSGLGESVARPSTYYPPSCLVGVSLMAAYTNTIQVDVLCPSQQVSSHIVKFPVFPSWTTIKQRIKCLAQEHNTRLLVSLELVTPQSQVSHIGAHQGPELQCLLKVKQDLS